MVGDFEVYWTSDNRYHIDHYFSRPTFKEKVDYFFDELPKTDVPTSVLLRIFANRSLITSSLTTKGEL